MIVSGHWSFGSVFYGYAIHDSLFVISALGVFPTKTLTLLLWSAGDKRARSTFPGLMYSKCTLDASDLAQKWVGEPFALSGVAVPEAL